MKTLISLLALAALSTAALASCNTNAACVAAKADLVAARAAVQTAKTALDAVSGPGISPAEAAARDTLATARTTRNDARDALKDITNK